MHALIGYHLPALFSFRMLTANAFSARTLVCPTPAGAKLAMLSSLLRRDGAESGQRHLEWLARLGVAWSPPEKLAVSAATVRIWKGDQPNEPLVMSAGLREYVHASDPFGLALLDVPDGRRGDVEYALGQLRALGNAESLVQPTGPPRWVEDLPDQFTLLTDEDSGTGDFACALDDLGPQPSFDRLSVYRSPGRDHVPRLGEDRRRLLVSLPLRIVRRTVDGYVLERHA